MTSPLYSSAPLYVGYGGSMAATFDLGSGANRVLLLGVQTNDPAKISQFKVGGVVTTFQQIRNETGAVLYCLTNPPSGQQSVEVDFTTGDQASVGIAAIFTSVDQTTPIAAQGGSNQPFQSSPMSVSVSNAINGTAVSFIATQADTGDIFSPVGATLIAQTDNSPTDNGNRLGAMSYANGATSMSWSWTASAGNKGVSQVVVVLNPATGGTGGVTVNAIAANSTQSNTSGTGSATVTPAGQATATVTSKPLAAFGGLPLANTTIPNVVLLKLDRTVALSLANQVTNGSGQLVIPSTSLVSATDYMLAMFNADGTQRGLEKVTAV